LLVTARGNGSFFANGTAQGAGVVGFGALLALDPDGADHYAAVRGAQGYGSSGAGVHYDAGGRDTYTLVHQGQARAEGAGEGIPCPVLQGAILGTMCGPGLALLLSSGEDPDVYSAGTRAQASANASSVAILREAGGSDRYVLLPSSEGESARGQGFAREQAAAILLDERGDEVYEAGRAGDLETAAQGASIGGVAILADLDGHDRYAAGTLAQGAALRVLARPAGVSGAGRGAADLGLLFDLRGDDVYASSLASQGFGREGFAETAAVGTIALFVDSGGLDRYDYGGSKAFVATAVSTGISAWTQPDVVEQPSGEATTEETPIQALVRIFVGSPPDTEGEFTTALRRFVAVSIATDYVAPVASEGKESVVDSNPRCRTTTNQGVSSWNPTKEGCKLQPPRECSTNVDNMTDPAWAFTPTPNTDRTAGDEEITVWDRRVIDDVDDEHLRGCYLQTSWLEIRKNTAEMFLPGGISGATRGYCMNQQAGVAAPSEFRGCVLGVKNITDLTVELVGALAARPFNETNSTPNATEVFLELREAYQQIDRIPIVYAVSCLWPGHQPANLLTCDDTLQRGANNETPVKVQGVTPRGTLGVGLDLSTVEDVEAGRGLAAAAAFHPEAYAFDASGLEDPPAALPPSSIGTRIAPLSGDAFLWGRIRPNAPEADGGQSSYDSLTDRLEFFLGNETFVGSATRLANGTMGLRWPTDAPFDETHVYAGIATGEPASLPEQRAGGAVVWNGTAFLHIGGCCNATEMGDFPWDEIVNYDPAVQRSARMKVRLPQNLTHPSAAFLDGRVFFLGGETTITGTPTRQVWRYDPTIDKVDDPASLVRFPDLPRALSRGAAARAGERALLFGGVGDAGAVRGEIIAFGPTTDPSDVGMLLAPRASAAAALLGRYVYVFGGQDASGTPLDTIERYDTVTGAVVYAPVRLPTPLWGATAVSDGTAIFVLGGCAAVACPGNPVLGTCATSACPTNAILRFEPDVERVTRLDLPVPSGRFDAGGATDGRRIFLFGGAQGGSERSAQIARITPAVAGVTGTFPDGEYAGADALRFRARFRTPAAGDGDAPDSPQASFGTLQGTSTVVVDNPPRIAAALATTTFAPERHGTLNVSLRVSRDLSWADDPDTRLLGLGSVNTTWPRNDTGEAWGLAATGGDRWVRLAWYNQTGIPKTGFELRRLDFATGGARNTTVVPADGSHACEVVPDVVYCFEDAIAASEAGAPVSYVLAP
ncbi:MAG: hypothetical protein ACT4PT_10090, partial [Methanobacteriota archaeon]